MSGRSVSGLAVETIAQERFVRDVLAWGGARPAVPVGLVARLQERLAASVLDLHDDLTIAAAGRRGRTLSIGRRVLERRVCDGWQLDPEPFRHGWASVRATLARDAIAADLEARRSDPVASLVARVWHEAATRRPGDPSSRSAWLNALASAEADRLRDQVAALVEDVREVWPLLPGPQVLVTSIQRPLEVPLAGGAVTLFAVPDLVLDSPVHDGRARSLVVDLRTGSGRPQRDREALRFHALVVSLARGRPPFRWASYHVTEGRTEAEDLSETVLEEVADQVGDTIRQLARLGPLGRDRGGHDPASTLTAGPWCGDCRRRSTCAVAATAGRSGEVGDVTAARHGGDHRDRTDPAEDPQ